MARREAEIALLREAVGSGATHLSTGLIEQRKREEAARSEYEKRALVERAKDEVRHELAKEREKEHKAEEERSAKRRQEEAKQLAEEKSARDKAIASLRDQLASVRPL